MTLRTLSEEEFTQLCEDVFLYSGNIIDNVQLEKKMDTSMDEEGALLRAVLREISKRLEIEYDGIVRAIGATRYAQSCIFAIPDALSRANRVKIPYNWRKIMDEKLMHQVLPRVKQ